MRDNLFEQKTALDSLVLQDAATPLLAKRWLKDADQALDKFNGADSKKDGAWWSSFGIALGLLKQAQNVIGASRKELEEKDVRIRELEALISQDELTGLQNRRGFIQAFEREVDRAQRGRSQGGLVMMIDLDNFKSINDIYGHAAGDIALKIVAEALSNSVRTMDVVARQGGDEFAILLVNTDRSKMLARTQMMIRALNNLSFEYKDNVIPVRASIGLKEFGKNSNPETVLDEADQSMYASKRQTKDAPIKQDNKRMI